MIHSAHFYEWFYCCQKYFNKKTSNCSLMGFDFRSTMHHVATFITRLCCTLLLNTDRILFTIEVFAMYKYWSVTKLLEIPQGPSDWHLPIIQWQITHLRCCGMWDQYLSMDLLRYIFYLEIFRNLIKVLFGYV